MKNTNQAHLTKSRELQSRLTEQSNTIESLKSQLGELNTFLRNRDSALSKESALRRDAEIEIEKLHVKLDEAERALESNKPIETESSQLEALRVSNSILTAILERSIKSLYAANSKLHYALFAEAGSKTQLFELVGMFSASSVQTRESLRDRESAQTAVGHLRQQTL
jgi:chromosome segregation ATPase